jgi:hypothetical protein
MKLNKLKNTIGHLVRKQKDRLHTLRTFCRQFSVCEAEVIKNMLNNNMRICDIIVKHGRGLESDFEGRKKIGAKELVALLIAVIFLLLPGQKSLASPVPDTGQSLCYDAGNSVITCPAPGELFYGQEGNFNINPRSYTKLDASGNALHTDTASWTMVKDNVTGLIWEAKTDDDSIHDKDRTFTWCDTNLATNGGNQGVCDAGTGDAATDTQAFINALNSANYGGYNDWRMPTVKELSTLVNSSIAYQPAIDDPWFRITMQSNYWSSTTDVNITGSAWNVSFASFNNYPVGVGGKSDSLYVRAVRAGQPESFGSLIINGDGTATDADTGLMWQQATAPGTFTWEQALSYVATLNSTSFAGYQDWRLPDINELQSLVDYSQHDPAVDSLLASDTMSSIYWSSTVTLSAHNKRIISFDLGYIGAMLNTENYYVRPVRAGQNQLLGSLIIFAPTQGARWFIGEQQTITWDTAGITGYVKITLSRQGGKTGTFTETIADNIPNSGAYTWTVTGPPSVNSVLKIEPLSDPSKATTQGLFTITFTLTVAKDGTGTGTVASNPSGINCGNDCSYNYTYGNQVTLTAIADANYVFSGWSGGGCSGSSTTCEVAMMDASKNVTATFSDISAPTGTIAINSGEGSTNSLAVTLSLACADAGRGCSQMQFSYDGTNWSDPEAYATTKSWNLLDGDGEKTVYVKFQDGAGNWSGMYSDTIILDTVLPVATISLPGGTYIGSQTVALHASKEGFIYYTLDGSIPTTSSHVYTSPVSMKANTTLKYFAKDVAGNESAIQTADFIIATASGSGRPNPDTGQTKCFNNTTEISCPAPGETFYGQDGNYNIYPPSYTKLDATGNTLPDDATSWTMVQDNVTGLIWENKTSNGSVHDGIKGFTWCDTNPATNGGNQGVCGTGTGEAATDTESYIKALNDAKFGGFSDWRIPTIIELTSVVDHRRIDPAINTNYFSNMQLTRYWTSHASAPWVVYMGNGYVVDDGNRENGYHVLAVRSGKAPSAGHLISNGDGTVTDNETGLMWQQSTSASTMNWEDALSYAEGFHLAGYDDWRLPTISELQSIVDYSLRPAINMNYFPNVQSGYWSSTTTTYLSEMAWALRISDGRVLYGWKLDPISVWLVRSGLSPSLGSMAVNAPRRADRWNIGEQKTISWDTAGISGNVKITLSRQGGKTGTFTETIAENVPNNGILSWTVAGSETFNAMLKIEPLSDPSKGTTQGLFSICYLQGALIVAAKLGNLGHYKLTLNGQYTDGTIPVDAAFTTSDATIARVDPYGFLTALKNGYVEVSATYQGQTYKKGFFVFTTQDWAETESNNEKTLADSLMVAGKTFYQGTLPEADVDWFRFTLASPSVVNVGYLSKSATADVKVDLYSSADVLLASETSQNGSPLILPVGLPAGDYYLKLGIAGDVDQTENYIVTHKVLDTLPDKTITPIALDETKQGTINTLDDRTDFTFTLAAEQAVKLTFTPTSASAAYHLSLLNSSETVIDANDCLEHRPVSMEATYGPGSYTLRVTPVNVVDAENPFTLSLAPSSNQLEKEPNDTAAQATPFDIAQPMTGRLSVNTDTDFYAFTLETPRFLELHFAAAGSDTPFAMTLYKESDQNEIDGINVLDPQSTSWHMGLSVGRYYLKVTGTNTVHPYTLTFRDSPQTDLEIESNNTLWVANAIGKAQPKRGRIYSVQDKDYYGFNLPEADFLTIQFTPSSTTGSYKVSLVDENDTPLGSSYTSSGGTALNIADILLDMPGNYYLKIEPNGTIDQYNPYQLTLNGTVAFTGIKQMVSVAVTGQNQAMTINDTQTLTATAAYSDATATVISAPAWTSLDTAVAEVNAAGQVTAIAQGTTSIVATYGGITGKFDLTVGAPQNVVRQHHGNLILVAGGGIAVTNTLKESTQYLSDLVYRRFKARLFTDEDIYYFNPHPFHDLNGDGFGENIVKDTAPTVGKFGLTVTQWATDQSTDGPLYIYLIDHGDTDSFQIFPGENLTAAQLKGFIDTFQAATNRQVIVMIEACKSGSFTNDLVTTGQDRIVVTSTTDQYLLMSPFGRDSFTQFFLDKLWEGDSIQTAFDKARQRLISLGAPYSQQSPQKAEGVSLASVNAWIGGNFIVAGALPEFTGQTANQSIAANTTQALFARLDPAVIQTIEKVWAVIIPPVYETSGTETQVLQFPTLDLADADKDGQYDGSYNAFTYSGDYRVTFYASNTNGNIITSAPTVFSVTGGMSAGTPGDINGDGDVTLADAILALQITAGVTPATGVIQAGYIPTSGDANTDNKIGITEAIYILQTVAGMR